MQMESVREWEMQFTGEILTLSPLQLTIDQSKTSYGIIHCGYYIIGKCNLQVRY